MRMRMPIIALMLAGVVGCNFNETQRIESGNLVKVSGTIEKVVPDSGYDRLYFHFSNGDVVRYYVPDGFIIPTGVPVTVYVNSYERVEKIEKDKATAD